MVQGGYRFEILLALAQSRQCVTSLASTVDVSLSTVSQNLNVLNRNNVVRAYRKGKWVEYDLSESCHVHVDETNASLVLGTAAQGVISIVPPRLEESGQAPIVTVIPGVSVSHAQPRQGV